MASTNLRDSGSRALRRGRISVAGHIYLVTFTTHERTGWVYDFETCCVARLKAAVTRELRRVAGAPLRIRAVGFHDRAVRREDDLRILARHVVMKPVRKGLARSAWEYPFWECRVGGGPRRGQE